MRRGLEDGPIAGYEAEAQVIINISRPTIHAQGLVSALQTILHFSCTLSFSSQGFSELGMTSESKALKSLFFGQVCLTVDLTPIPPGLGMGLGDIYIVLM